MTPDPAQKAGPMGDLAERLEAAVRDVPDTVVCVAVDQTDVREAATALRHIQDLLHAAQEEVRGLQGSSRDHEHTAGVAPSGDAEHLRLAMNGVKAALPILYMLMDNEYNVDTWGLNGRMAALQAARDYKPSSAKPLERASSRDDLESQLQAANTREQGMREELRNTELNLTSRDLFIVSKGLFEEYVDNAEHWRDRALPLHTRDQEEPRPAIEGAEGNV